MLNRWTSCLSLNPALNALWHIYLYLWISYIIKDMVTDFLAINGIWRETPIFKQGWCFEPWQDIGLNSWVWARDSQRHTRGNPQVKTGEKKGFVLKQLNQSLRCAWDGAEGWVFHGTLHCPVSCQPSQSHGAADQHLWGNNSGPEEQADTAAKF